MKKIIYLFVIAIILVACQDEYEPGATETEAYSGEWFYYLMEEDMSPIYEYEYHGDVFLTYNSSQNIQNEIWIDDQGYSLPVKAKLTLSGTSDNFTSNSSMNVYAVGGAEAIPQDGAAVKDTVGLAFVKVLEGKILKQAAKVWQDREQAPADSIFLMLEFSSAIFNYTSRMNISDGDTTFYLEEDENFYNEPTPYDTLIISGHRQTGWEVYL